MKSTRKDNFDEFVKAINDGNTAQVSFLLGGGGIDLGRRHNGSTALMLAANNGHIDIVERLLKVKVKPVDVNAKDSNGQTALMIAAKNDREKIVERLLQVKGINVDAKDKNNKRAADLAGESTKMLFNDPNVDIDGTVSNTGKNTVKKKLAGMFKRPAKTEKGKVRSSSQGTASSASSASSYKQKKKP